MITGYAKTRFALFLLTVLILSVAHAEQRIDARGGKPLAVRIASDEPTLIAVEGRRIRKVWGAKNKAVLRPDTDSGQILIRPQGAWKRQAFSLFLKDNKGKIYTLVLTPAPIPSDTVILVPEPWKRERRDRRKAIDWEASQPYEKTLIELIRHMALSDRPVGYRIVAQSRRIDLWEEAELTLIAQYLGGNLDGEVYQLRNVSDKPMRLAEQEFYRPGVLAVSIEHLVLDPGQTTEIFLVTEAEEDDE